MSVRQSGKGSSARYKEAGCCYSPLTRQRNNVGVCQCAGTNINDFTHYFIDLVLWYFYYRILQKQSNHSDCGLFAIANAMALCNGQTPEHLYYDIKGMRQHLAGCLEDKVF